MSNHSPRPAPSGFWRRWWIYLGLDLAFLALAALPAGLAVYDGGDWGGAFHWWLVLPAIGWYGWYIFSLHRVGMFSIYEPTPRPRD